MAYNLQLIYIYINNTNNLKNIYHPLRFVRLKIKDAQNIYLASRKTPKIANILNAVCELVE